MSSASPPWPVGRRFVVTGATSGIGLEIARGILRAGGDLVIVGRNPTRCAEVSETLRRESPGRSVESAIADLSSQRAIHQLAEEIEGRFAVVHGLVNNAGGVFSERQETVDGVEWTFALNVLAPFLLTNLLGERLKVSAPARVVNVASAAHQGAALDFDDLEARHGYSGFRVYSRSKLALLLLTYEFARRWNGSGVTVNAVHPGFVRSGFGQNNPGALSVGIRLAGIFAIGLVRGARTPVHAATAPELAGVSGRYFSGMRAVRSSRRSMDESAGRRLWEYCVARTDRRAPVPMPLAA